MTITLNGEPFELDQPLSVTDLLARLEIDPRRVAVEHNLTILKRHTFTTVVIGEREVLVIDTCYLPSSADADTALIRGWTEKPVRGVLNTHWHNDHVGGNQRYRLDLYVNIQNLFNKVNYNAFVGNQLSLFFGQATSAGPARRVEIGASVSF